MSDLAYFDRPKLKNDVYMDMALALSRLSTCLRTQVGCILLDSRGRVVGAGYNGSGPDMPHCSPETCGPDKRCLRCAHAETNALANASGVAVTVYCTHEPCLNCTRELVIHGCKRIYFRHPYLTMAEDEKIARKEWLDFHRICVVHLEE